jgi:hypothetical protein
MLTAAALAAFIGAICTVIAALSPTYVDESGFLHEPFAWMASGRILLLISVVGFLMAAFMWAIRRIRYP